MKTFRLLPTGGREAMTDGKMIHPMLLVTLYTERPMKKEEQK